MISRLARSRLASRQEGLLRWPSGVSRAFGGKLKEDMGRLNIPYHPELVYDFSKIIQVVKTEQQAFEKSPYSRTAFSSYLAVDSG